MSKYALLFVGEPQNVPANADSNAEWGAWVQEQKAKHIYHSGSAFSRGTSIVNETVSDLELGGSTVGGYVVLEAKDLDEAGAVAKTSPHAKWGGVTEIRLCRDI